MDQLLLEHSGPLSGAVRVSGAKNAALPIMAACLLTDEPSVIEHVPGVADVFTMAEILRRLEVDVQFEGNALHVVPGAYTGRLAPYELVSRMRASVCVLGPLLARHGAVKVSMPGGCVIGSRPIDLHLKGLAALGATISNEHGYIVATADRLRGAQISLTGAFGSSVLATGNVMMAATLAEGTTVIEGAAREPEVADLANCLVRMGAKITGQGTARIQIEGVSQLSGARHEIISDRIEAGTLMIAVAMLGGKVRIEQAEPAHLEALIETLTEAGVDIDAATDEIRIQSTSTLQAVSVTTMPYPGFPTDLQAPVMALMSMARGTSVLTERVYPERFMHVSELNRMGADITREGASAIVRGVAQLSGAPVVASDLRAAAALVLAGLAAEKYTEFSGVEHLERGYQDLDGQLAGLGAKIKRVKSEARAPVVEA